MRTTLSALIVLLISSMVPALGQTVLFQDAELIQAAKVGDYDRTRLALIKGDNSDTANFENETPFIVASKGEYIDILELLLEYNASINWQDSLGNTALFYAVDKSSYDLVDFLLENNAMQNITNKSGVTPLMTAAIIGDRDVLHLLLNKNPDLTLKDYTGRTLLDYARDSRNRDAVNILSKAGATD